MWKNSFLTKRRCIGEVGSIISRALAILSCIQYKCQFDSWDWNCIETVHRNLTTIDKIMNELANETDIETAEPFIQPFHGEIQFSICYQDNLTSGNDFTTFITDYS